jgi:hypothetical protein
VVFQADPTMVPAGALVISFFDDADQAGDLGWHTEGPNGVQYGKVFVNPVLQNGGTPLTGELSVSSVLSHEVVEGWLDPTCSLWVDTNAGKLIAYEGADPVENDSYQIGVGQNPVRVSNFVYPNWFDAQAPKNSRFDYLGRVKGPFLMSKNGYYVSMAEGQPQQEFDDAEHYPAWKQKTKQYEAARTARRLKAVF